MRDTAAAICAGLAALALLLLVVPSAAVPAVAQTRADVDLDAGGVKFSLLPPGERLTFEDRAPSLPAGPTAAPAAPERQPNWLLTSIVAAGAPLGAALNSFFDGPRESYHLANEGWFGQHTHYGGADKASHFTSYHIVSKELSNVFVLLGHKPERARWLAAGVASLTGLVNEIGDGTTRYGFAYEDLVMDVGGALCAALISAASAEDLVGFRRGIATLADCCNYSSEIYTADLQLSGVARRLGLRIGPLNYLLLSVTYGTKGYPGDSGTQRQVGFEVGLNFKQMLDDLKVGRHTWWGYGLHVVFDNVRLPFTAVGFRYDLNHGRWHGPNAGD